MSKKGKGKIIVTSFAVLQMLLGITLIISTVPNTILGDAPHSSNNMVNSDGSLLVQKEPSMAIDSTGTVYIAWGDSRNGNSDIYFANSTDDGVTWSNPNMKINSDVGTTTQSEPAIAVGPDDTVYAVWEDRRSGDVDIYFSKSTDGGATWSDPDIKVNSGTDTESQSAPSIAVNSSGAIHVVWEDRRDGDLNIYFTSSTDGGNTWDTPNKKINTDTTTEIQSDPVIAVDSQDTIYVAWEDERSGDWDIYFASSSDSGATWTDPNIKINDDSGTLTQRNPTITAGQPGHVYLTWQDHRNLNADIYFAQSTDYGASWGTPNVMINSDSGSADQYSPYIAKGSYDILHVAWHDKRQGDDDIYYSYSMDGGATWLDQDERVNDGSLAKSQKYASVASGSGGVYIAWEDDRNDNTDIYASSRAEPIPPSPSVGSLEVDGFSANTAEIQHLTSHTPVLSFTYTDIDSNPMSQYNISIWDAGGSALLWFTNATDSLPSGSEVSVTYNTAPNPTTGPPLVDGTWYRFKAQAANSSGAWSTVSEANFHLNEVLVPVTPITPSDNSHIVASAIQTVSWTSPGGDSENDTIVSFSWQVASDSGFTNIIESGSGLVYESAPFNTIPSGAFYWRVNLTDGWETSNYGNQPEGYWNFTTYTSTSPNNPPTITNIGSVPTSASQNTSFTFTFEATDPDSDPLTWSKISGPDWLNIGAANGTIYGTPSSGDAGSNEFTIQVADGREGTLSHTFTITVDSGQDGGDNGDANGDDSHLLILIIIIVIIVVIVIALIARR